MRWGDRWNHVKCSDDKIGEHRIDRGARLLGLQCTECRGTNKTSPNYRNHHLHALQAEIRRRDHVAIAQRHHQKRNEGLVSAPHLVQVTQILTRTELQLLKESKNHSSDYWFPLVVFHDFASNTSREMFAIPALSQLTRRLN